MIESTAEFSSCKKYRYQLKRIWDKSKPTVTFIGLNPSTADETKDDPTIRRCIGYAKKWGFGGLIMANVFAYRSTDPKKLKEINNPVGNLNGMWILKSAFDSDLTIAAWGTHGALLNRTEFMRNFGIELHVLGLTKEGHPKHPLYLKQNLIPVLWDHARR